MLSTCWINSPPLHLPECEWSSYQLGRSSALGFSASWTDYNLKILCDWGTSVQMDDRTEVSLAPSPKEGRFRRMGLTLHRYVLTTSFSNGRDCIRPHDVLSSSIPPRPLPLRAVPRASCNSCPGRWRRAGPCIISRECEKESQWQWATSART